MSKEFKKSLQEKYGSSGLKGQMGEYFFEIFYTDKGYNVIKTDKKILPQIKGIDFVLMTPKGTFTVDVKNNLTNHNEMVIEMNPDGWLFSESKISQFISHVNVKNQIVASYRREQMIKFLENNYWDFRNDLLYLNVKDVPFVKVERAYAEAKGTAI